MILGYSAVQVRLAEKAHLDAGEPLMQRAAAGLASEIEHVLEGHGARAGREAGVDPEAGDGRGSRFGRVLIVAGSGDNGGDALFAGAALAASGCDVRLVTTGERVHEEGLAAALAAGVDATARAADPGSTDFDHLLDGIDVVVDGVLGTGSSANPALRGRARTVIEAIRPRVLMRRADAPSVVAVDIPSGIGSDDGSVPDPMVLPALVTVTFGAVKAGLLLAPGSGLAGRICLVDIGLLPDLAGVNPLVTLPGDLREVS